MEVRWTERYAARTHQMTSSAIRELLMITERPDFISFAGGLPAPELFPVEEVAAVSGRVLLEGGSKALQYSTTEGYRPLRELIAERMRHDGIPVTVDNILITTGSQQALDLIGKILLDPGDAVAVESPTYLAAVQAWRAYEAEYLAVASDDCGMDVGVLSDLAHRQPKFVYCLPNFQNPKGVTLSGERRERVVDISMRHGIPIVEDDPYGELRFEGAHLPRIITVEARRRSRTNGYRGNVISIGTFSKTLAPGLRVGWVVAATELMAQLIQAKQSTDLHTSTLDQMIAFEMLRSGYLEKHRNVIIQTYRERRDIMLAALAEHFPVGATWTRPAGGMFLWVELPASIDAAALLREAMELRVAFVPGKPFHVDGAGRNTLRLNFSNSTPEKIREGIARLALALRRVNTTERRDTHSSATAISG